MKILNRNFGYWINLHKNIKNVLLVGYYHYYGITDNGHCLDAMRRKVVNILFYWLNRRSQKRSYTWDSYHTLLKVFNLARPKIYVNIYG